MDIKIVLEKHAKWLSGGDGGECADLRGAKADEVKWDMYTTF